MDKILELLSTKGVELGQQVIMAVLALVVGRWIIGMAGKLLTTTMSRQKIDSTLTQYAVSVITGVLNIILVISILGILGIQTTSFAALLASVGLAVGLAMSGLLSNFASGVFLMVLRPFKVGDFISAGGITGTVTEIGIFATKINTPDNVQTVVGNGKIFADNIQNFSHNAYRRVDLNRHFGANVELATVATELTERLLAIPNVLSDPAPNIEILEFRAGGPLLAIRPYCHNDHYWQVYFDSNKVILSYCDEKGFAAPEQAVVVRQN
ncbi:mechanosensitive ion channel family protein [Armatimonas sp.]|uniref:mechanosensitive ion channel family protein n=1 Tax=Armatimonas sp. TaxID=1872638 RepID=UPI00286BEAB1|nr:mechanosensitive ion channel family protein [Armatimonas sp.]